MKKQLKIAIVSAAVCVVLLLVYLLALRPLLNADEDRTPTGADVRFDLGEAYYSLNGTDRSDLAVLFRQINRSTLCSVRVHNDDEDYLFYHMINPGTETNYFALANYPDGAEDPSFYEPPITGQFGDFDYTTLYDDTSKIPVMIAASGAVVFKERIYVRVDQTEPVSDEEYQKVLAKYGLSDADDPAWYEITAYVTDANGNYMYMVADAETGEFAEDQLVSVGTDGKYYLNTTDDAGNIQTSLYEGDLSLLSPMIDADRTYRVYVGDMTVAEDGYYLRVEGRDVIYTTINTTVGDVVFRNLGYYVYPRLVTKAADSYTARMAMDFSFWEGTGEDNGMNTAEGTPVTGDALAVISYTGLLTSLGEQGGGTLNVRLSEEDPDSPAYSILLGAGVGDTVTLPFLTRDLMTGGGGNTLCIGERVVYTFTGIVGILDRTSGTLDRTEGKTPGQTDMLVVTYTSDLAGGDSQRYGVIDLSEQMPDALRDLLLGHTVGEKFLSSFTLTYDAGIGAGEKLLSYSVTAITAIVRNGESLEEEGAVAQAGDTVLFTYVMTVDGESYEYTGSAYLTDDSTAGRTLSDALIGKQIGTYAEGEITVELHAAQNLLQEVMIYTGAHIDYTVSYDLILSFRFVNESDRNLFYGTGIYEPTAPSDKTFYGLSTTATSVVVPMFEDLTGEETVAVGLTPEVMERYGLYAYSLYYEMPFRYSSKENEDDNLDFNFYDRVGFMLYISKENPDGSRYVASEMYDIVVKISADTFDFLEWDFLTQWARPELVLTSVFNISELTFEFNYSDFQGKYSYAVTSDPEYRYETIFNGESSIQTTERLYVAYVYGENITYRTYTMTAEEFEKSGIKITAGRTIEQLNEDTYYIKEVANANAINLDAYYGDYFGNKRYSGVDYAGVLNFKTLALALFSSQYAGASEDDLTEEEIAELIADEDACVLTMTMTLINGRTYVYRFYPYSARRALVSLSGEGRESHVFYMKSEDVRRYVGLVLYLVNGKEIDPEQIYIDTDGLLHHYEP